MIISRSDGPVAAYEQGWKDVVLVQKGETVRFITQFTDYADAQNAYMFHCHITVHEDAGMMGQFVVMPDPTVTIADASTSEGNSGTKQMNFNVSLNNTSSLPIKLTYSTQDGTATAPSDYVAQSGTLTFKPGEKLKTISVVINGDGASESNETFRVNISKPKNAVLGNTFGTGTITNDDGSSLITKNEAINLSGKNNIRVSPNPIVNSTTISFSLAQVQKVSVDIFDLNGRLVKRFADVQVHGGANQLVWDARDFNGSPVKPGTYFLHFAAGTYTETKKLIVVQ